MDQDIEARLAEKLKFLYNNSDLLEPIKQIIAIHAISPRVSPSDQPILIAYGDHLQADGEAPLQTLHRFAHEHLRDVIGAVHLLPFFPYSSDDGFSVIDYLVVNDEMGNWSDIEGFQPEFRLMFDLVLNHCSVSSDWFQRFLRDEAPYNEFFVTESPETDLSAVVRPRTHPLLTPFETAAGTRYVWTTFSADQVDLNYANPTLLLEMIRILLEYVERGADFIRLDAVAFLWKIAGTRSIHLPQTHVVVQVFRDVLDVAAPWVKLITETNVPHEENLSYFGNGINEAQLIYQFALPPLLLHTFYTGNADLFSDWVESLETPSKFTTFFNFTASHDGIGLRPVSDLLPQEAIEALIQVVQERGGHISYKANSDGSQSAYEMNITLFDALADLNEPLEVSVNRFIASQAIMLALSGLPAIYFGSLFGAANWHDGVAETGRSRSINREKFDMNQLIQKLSQPESRYEQVFSRYRALLRKRAECTAFRATVPQRVLHLGPEVFALQRGELLTLHNVCDQEIVIDIPGDEPWHCLLSGIVCQDIVRLQAYQVMWLELGESSRV